MEGLNVKSFKKAKQPANTSISFDWLNRDIKLFKPGFGNKKKEAFYLEVSSMLSAGMNLKYVLDMLIDQKANAKEKELFTQIKNDLVQGYHFSQALERTKLFTPYEYFSVKIGEESGQLTIVLTQLADFYTKRIKQNRQLVSSLSYPIVVLLSSVLAVVFMLTFMVPMFSDVFARFGGKLPALTKALMDVSNMLRYNFIFLLVPVVGLGGLLYYLWNKDGFKKKRQMLFSKIPVMGQLYTSIYLARFATSMALLTAAKVPLLQALDLIRQMVDFQPIRLPLHAIEKDIMNGITLNESMSKFSIFDKKLVSLVKVGEEVNKLDFFFDKISKRFNDEIEMRTSVINTFLEPLIIVFLGLVIGVILIAMYLPMFTLSTTVG